MGGNDRKEWHRMKPTSRKHSDILNTYHWLVVITALLLAACQPIRPEAASTATSTVSAETPTASTTSLVGTWTTTVTKEDVLRVVPDFKQEHLCDNTGY